MRIKWPNDLHAKGMKIGGILCQSVYREGVFHLIIGAGLNVTNCEPTTCVAALIAEKRYENESGSTVTREVST